MYSRVFLLLLLLSVKVCHAQNTAQIIDSLEKLLAKKYSDSNKVNLILSRGEAEIYRNREAATRLTEEGLALAQKAQWKRGIAIAYRQKGVIYETAADYPNALEASQTALKTAASLNDDKFNASIYNNMGKVSMQMGEFDKSLESFNKLLSTAEKLKSERGKAIALLNIGLVSLKKEDTAAARKYTGQSVAIAEANHFDQIAAYALSNMGVILNAEKKMPEAIAFFNKSIEYATIINDLGITAESNAGISESLIYMNKFNEAAPYAKQGLQLAIATGSFQYQKECYQMLSDIYLHQKKYDSALVNYKKYVEAKDSLVNEEKKSDVVRTEMKFENEKKEAVLQLKHEAEIKQESTVKKAIAWGSGILFSAALVSFIFYKKRRDAKQKQQEAEFKTEVAGTEMKALRAQMNPHFIFNSLNSISDYIAKNDIQEADRYLSKFAKLMRMILENSEQKDVPLTDDLKALELYMQLEALRMNNKFSYEIKVDDEIDKETIMIPPLILQPFVENSIWHGIARKEGPGKILIHIKKEGNDMINCIVEDDGIGRKQSAAIKTTAPKQEKTSLGMKITQARIDILNKIKNTKAVVELSDLAQGMRVEVKLPLATNF